MTVTVSEIELQSRWPELMELVRHGEQVLIQHEGEVVACLVQPPSTGPASALAETAKGVIPKLTLSEIMAWRHEDHAT